MLYPKKNLIPKITRIAGTYADNVAPKNEWYTSFIPTTSLYATIKGDYDIELVANGNNSDVKFLTTVKPNAIYRASAQTNGDIHLYYFDASFTRVGQTYDMISKNLTSVVPQNAVYAAFVLTNRGLGAGVFNFRNWQLEEVTTITSPATEFEPYTLINKPAERNLSFNGNGDYASIGVIPEFSNSNYYSVEALVKVKQYKDAAIVSNWLPSPNRDFLFAATGTGFQFVTYAQNANGNVSIGTASSETNKPVHVVATYNKGEMKLYIDGVLKATRAGDTVRVPSGNPIELGRHDGSPSKTLGMNLYNVRLYKKVLSQEEINGNISGKVVRGSDLVAEYDFAIPFSSKVIKDRTINKNDGVLYGASPVPPLATLQPAKTLFDAKDFDAKKTQGAGNTYMYVIGSLKPNTDYTVSTNALLTASSTANIYVNGSNTDPNGVRKDTPRTVKSSTNGTIYLLVRYDSDAYKKVVTGEYWIRVEEGAAATPPEANKPAPLYTKKNLIKPFTDSEWNLTANVVSREAKKLVLQMDGSKTNDLVIPTKPNTTYTISGKTTGRVYITQRLAGNVDKPSTGTNNFDSFSRTITTGSDVIGIRVSCTTDNAGTLSYEDFQIEEGSTATPYEPYKLVNKPAVLYPQKNLFPNDTFVKGSWIGVPAALNQGTNEQNLFRSLPKPIRLKAGTYIISSNAAIGAGIQVFEATTTVIASSNTALPTTFTLTRDNDVYFHFKKNDNSAWNLSDKPQDLQIQLEVGSKATAFEPYKLVNKQ